MRPSFAAARRAALVVSASFLLASCGGSGDTTTIAYSGVIDGYECSDYYMALYLEESGTELAKGRGGISCELGPELEGRGCRFFAEESDERLQVVLLDCPFDLSEALFRCHYTQADVQLMNRWAFAGCCFNRNSHNGYCDNLLVCFTDEETGASCEDCYNGVDDDGDGLVDCDDTLCRKVPECEPTTTTTLPASTTTTTLPYACDVRFRLTDAVSAGFLDWHVDYAGAPGGFGHSGDTVACSSLVSGTAAEFDDFPSEDRLEIVLSGDQPIEGPTDLAECRFLSSAEVAPGGFIVTVIEALTIDSERIYPLPAIGVSDVQCNSNE
jgi:hypothetical protein